MVTIHKSFIPASNKKLRPGYSMSPDFITLHNTANKSKGADAEMHARYLLNGAGGRQVSWHYTVDDKEIYQHLPTDENGWHAGDGQGNGNRNSIGIEICENADGDFDKAVSNAAWLVRRLMDEHNIPIENVVPHKHWSGKNCPHLLLGHFDNFRAQVTGVKHNPAKQHKTKSASSTGLIKNGDKGARVESLQKRLMALGYDLPEYGADGDFGDETEGALREFQQDADIEDDGIYGPQTENALKKAESKPEKSTKEHVYLPADATSWRIYPTNKAPVKGNEKGFLNPAKFNGLKYEILGKPQANVVTIKSSDFGKGNIYVAPSTGAKIK